MKTARLLHSFASTRFGPGWRRQLPVVLVAGAALFLGSGCVSIPETVYVNAAAYEPQRVGAPIDASASFTVEHTLAPELHARWKRWANSEKNINAYLNAVRNAVGKDLATSGFFARVADSPTSADYRVSAVGIEMEPSDFRVRYTLVTHHVASGAQVSSQTREVTYGTGMMNAKLNLALPGLMAALKHAVAADVQQHLNGRREEAARVEAETFLQTPLADLLAGADRNVTLARARNRALVAAKTTQLPGILRDAKTAELTTLVVRLEQTVLDLDHECELAKDQAQRAVAAQGADATRLDELRGLAISYRERIELVKPMLAALKEEIANRGR